MNKYEDFNENIVDYDTSSEKPFDEKYYERMSQNPEAYEQDYDGDWDD